MTLREKIPEDLKNALRIKNELELSVLRMLQASIRNKEIELKRGKEFLTDEEVIEVISGEVKRRKDAASEYTKANRQDLADKEKAEVDILMRYMPKQMEEEEIRLETRNVIDEVNALSVKDMGKVMKSIMPRLKGRAEGSLVSRIVREELEKKETP
jgi:uncharacterized protein YqeY